MIPERRETNELSSSEVPGHSVRRMSPNKAQWSCSVEEIEWEFGKPKRARISVTESWI